MPVPVTCPNCDSRLRAPDKLAGQYLPCPKCKAPVPVPAGVADGTTPRRAEAPGGRQDGPARPRLRPDEAREGDGQDAPTRPAPSSAPLVVVAVAATAFLLAAGGGLAFWMTRPAGTPPAPAVALPAPDAKKPTPPAHKPAPPVDATMDAPALVALLGPDINEQKHLKKRYEVTGVVVGSAPGKLPPGAVELRGRLPGGTGLVCEFGPADAAKTRGLKAGQAVTIHGVNNCTFRDNALGIPCPALDGCTLVRAGEPPNQETPAAPEGWLDAPGPARVGAVEVRVKSAEVAVVRVRPNPALVTTGTRPRPKPLKCLVVRVVARNGGTAVAYYRRPQAAAGAPFTAALADEAGTAFPPSLGPRESADGQQPDFTVELPPGGEAEDIICFDASPLGKGAELRLELPLNCFHPESAASDPSALRRLRFRIQQKAVGVPKPPYEPGPETAARVEALVAQLKSGEAEKRAGAAEALGGIGPKARAAGRALCEAGFDKDRRVRVAAIDALKRVDAEVYGLVARMARAPTTYDHTTEVAQIGRLGPRGAAAVPVLLRYMDANAKEVFFRDGALAVDALAKIAPRDEAVAARFVGWLGDHGDANVRLAAAKALPGMKGGAKAVAAMAQALAGDTSAPVRAACAKGLGLTGPNAPAVVAALKAARSDKAATVRDAAKLALAEVEARPAEAGAAPDAEAAARAAELARGLKDKRASARVKAAEALGIMGEKAAPATAALIAAMFDPVRDVRVTAEDALKRVNPSLHGPVIQLMRPVGDFSVVKLKRWDEAVVRIGRMGTDGAAAVPVLIHYRQGLSRRRVTVAGRDPTAPSARLVAQALLKVAPTDPFVAKTLTAWLHQEPDAGNRAALARALPSVKGGKAVVSALAKSLRGDTDAAVRQAAAEALGRIGADASSARPALEKAKTDTSPGVREAAREALAKLKG